MYMRILDYRMAADPSEAVYMDYEENGSAGNYMNLPVLNTSIQLLANGILYIENGQLKTTTTISNFD